jgi:hypothetical protein
MSIADKLITATENIEKVYVAGKKTEYDAFWDSFQGEITDGAYLFAGRGWKDSNFRPKYNINIPNRPANNMFCNSVLTNLEASLQECGVTLDLSLAQRLDNIFSNCKQLTRVPEITIGENCTNIGNMFNGCLVLVTIRKLTFPNKSMTVTNAFNTCYALENIEIGGTIAVSGLSFQHSTKLTKASITSIINALSTSTSGLTITFSKKAKEAAFTSAEWTTLVNTKSNWTIALV